MFGGWCVSTKTKNALSGVGPGEDTGLDLGLYGGCLRGCLGGLSAGLFWNNMDGDFGAATHESSWGNGIRLAHPIIHGVQIIYQNPRMILKQARR